MFKIIFICILIFIAGSSLFLFFFSQVSVAWQMDSKNVSSGNFKSSSVAGMLRQNGDSNKRGLGLTKLSTSNFSPISNTGNWGMGRNIKSSSLSNINSNFDGYDSMIVDPDYIMQLVNDVRKFADVLLNLREAITSGVSDASW